jgi:hypothetical protein
MEENQSPSNAFMAFYMAEMGVDLSRPCTSVTHDHRKSLKYILSPYDDPPFVGWAGGVLVLGNLYSRPVWVKA